MNGTPSISEVYTVLGNRSSSVPARRIDGRVSLVVLARGPWVFRPQILAEFHSQGFLEVLCVEPSVPRYDAVTLLRQLPGLRILVSPRSESPGALINTAAREVRGDRFLLVWDDQSLPDSALSSKVQRLWLDADSVAVAPDRRDPRGREIPSVMVPGLDRDRLKILALGADEENVDSLFPADFSALYDRRRFLQTGGYDPDILTPFWQKVDWGIRSRLWGESIHFERAFKVDYRNEPPVEDQTPDSSYPRFYLRNLAVRHAGDHGVLPWTRLGGHLRLSGLPWSEAWTDFLKHRAWVRLHRYRYQTDARLLTELWGNR